MPKKESIVFPGSHCPVCGSPVRWYDNIPLVSWLVLAGRCRNCKGTISLQYPLVELITGVMYLFLYLKWGETPEFLLYSLLGSSFLIITLIDLRHKIIPDMITLPGILLGVLSSLVVQQITLADSIAGLLTGGVLFFLIAVASRGGMGGGDIKFMAMVGAFLGWKAALFTTLIGSLSGSIVGGLLILTGKKSRKDLIPFGPFLVFGATTYILWGQQIIRWYIMWGARLHY